MMATVRSRKIVFLVITAVLSFSILLGGLFVSYTFVPDVRRYAKSLPILQEVGLFLYRLKNPNQSDVRNGEARATEIVLQSPMGVAEDRAGNIFVGDRGK